MKKQRGFSAVEGLLILIVVGLVGFTGWYVLNAKHNADNSYNSAGKVSYSSSRLGSPLSKSSGLSSAANQSQQTTTPNTPKNSSASKSTGASSPASSPTIGIAMSISPNHGPVGTSVSIQITGIQDTSNLIIALYDSKNNYDDTGLTIQPAQVHNGNYSGTYIIPSTIFNALSGCAPKGCGRIATAKGLGKIVLTHGSSSDVYVSTPFTVE